METGSVLICVFFLQCLLSSVSGVIEFIAIPLNTAVLIGQDVRLDCLAQDDNTTGTLLYNWELAGNPVRPSTSLYANHSLFIPRVQQSDLGVYTCNVSSDGFLTYESRSAKVIEAYIEDFIAHPTSVESTLGETVTLTCITGSSAPSAVAFWEKDGQLFSGGDQHFATYGDVDPLGLGKQFSLKLALTVESSSLGVYRCVLENQLAKTLKKSEPAFLSLSVPETTPTLVKALPTELFAPEGQPINVDCVVEGNPTPTIRWLHDSVEITSNERVSVNGNGTLQITAVTVADGGLYLCQGVNSKGSVSSGYMTLQVPRLGLKFEQQPRDVHAIAGQSARILCTPPYSVPSATVTWYKGPSIFQPRAGEFPASVIQTEMGGWDLVFSNVQQEDAGSYICVAFNPHTVPKTRTSEVARLSVTGGAVFVEPPAGKELIKGQLLSLRCIVKGNPAPVVSWYKDGEPLKVSERITMARHQQELYISMMRKPDEGTYLCHVTSQFNNVSASAFVRVLVPPAILSQIGHVTVNLGLRSEVTLLCSVSGDPNPAVTWFKGEMQIRESRRIRIVDNNLHVQEVDVEDSGNYTCRAQNAAGLKTDTGSVSVIVPPVFVVEPVNRAVTIGQEITLRCEVTGVPSPSVYWTFNDTNSLPPNHIFPGDLSLVTIETMTWADVGKYTCHANNTAGQVEKSVYLTIQTLPRVLNITGQPVLPALDDLTLTCIATGIPPPKVRWLFKGQEVTTSLDGRISFPTNNMLMVKVGQESDSGTYSCVVENPAGQDVMSQEVVIFGPPVAPVLESVTPVSTTSLNITWSPVTQAAYADVTSFVLKYRESTAVDFVQYRDDLPASLTFTELGGLRPSRSYVVVMAARNGAGEGTVSSARSATTYESAPSAPRNLELLSVGTYEVRLRWEIPAETHGQIRQYQVTYRVKDKPGFQAVILTDPSLQDFTLESLLPHTTYMIQVRAATDLEREAIVWGNYTGLIEATTLYAAPTGSPQNVTSSAADSKTLVVTWQPVPQEDVNGPIISYLIKYTSDSPVAINQSAVVSVNRNDAVISQDVFPWRYYTVSVCAVNEAGQGPFSEPVTLQTTAEAPSGFPQELKMLSVSLERIVIEWKPVPAEERNGPISGYLVEYGVKGEILRSFLNITNGKVFTAVISNLLPYTLYQIRISAYTLEVNPGQGPYSPLLEARTSETAPGPVRNFSITVTSNSMSLSWLPPDVSTGLLSQYIIRYRQMENGSISDPILVTTPSDTLSAVLSDLSSDTVYQVDIAAQNGAGQGQTTALNVATDPGGEVTQPVRPTYPSHILGSPPPSTDNHKKHLPAIVAGSLTGGLAILFILGIIIYRCLKKRWRKNDERYYMSKVEEDLDSVSDMQIKSSASDSPPSIPSPTLPPHLEITAPEEQLPESSSQIHVQAVINNNNNQPATMPRSTKEKKLSGLDNVGFVDNTLGNREGSVRLSAEQVYSQIDRKGKKQYRMRTESAAAIAVERNRGIQVLTGDKDSLINNEAEIVYDERTAL